MGRSREARRSWGVRPRCRNQLLTKRSRPRTKLAHRHGGEGTRVSQEASMCLTGLGITGTASLHAMEALQAVHDARQGSGLGWGERPGSSGGSTRVLTPAHGWVLLAVGQAPVSTAGGRLALARDLGGRRVRHRVGLGHALERELRFLAVAVDIDDDHLSGLQLAEQDLLAP